MLHFFIKKAEYFRETVLKIEADNISAFEVSHHLDVLKGNIMLRKDEKYLDPTTEAEKDILIESDAYDEDIVNSIFEQFFGIL